MDFKLDVSIKKLSTNDVILNLQEYAKILGFTGNLTNSIWYLGYACALRDAGIINYSTWGELTEKASNKKLLKLMESYSRRNK